MSPGGGHNGCVTESTCRLSRRLPALCLAVAVLWPATGGQAACPAVRRAELPITVLRNFLLVPVALDGSKVTMVVDTGAEATTVTPGVVKTLGLARTHSRTMLLGVGGAVRSGGAVRPHHLEFGGLVHSGLALEVSALPSLRGTERPVAGLLGADVLSAYDIALDLPRRTMTLYAVPACPGFVPPGYEAADGHDLQRVNGGLLFLAARIDGHKVRALLDTGARQSLVARRMATRLGATNQDLSHDPVVRGRGVGARALAFRRHRFEEVQVGGIAVRDMELNVAALPIPGVDMLLGADWLTGHQVWISRAAGRLFQH